MGTTCHRFPVVVGETGSGFDSLQDIDFMEDLALYLHNIGGLLSRLLLYTALHFQVPQVQLVCLLSAELASRLLYSQVYTLDDIKHRYCPVPRWDVMQACS